MKVIKRLNDGTFTEYLFMHDGHEERTEIFKHTVTKQNRGIDKHLFYEVRRTPYQRSCYLMSERQRNILEYIKSYTAENLYPPTIREIATAVGLKSPSTVHGHLDRMRENGYINFVNSSPRTLTVVS